MTAPKEHIMGFDSEENDILVFEDEKPTKLTGKHRWRLLVVDDDESIHTSTKFVLADFTFEGCSLDLLHAYNSDDAKELLSHNDDIAVILLDVIMETDDAGLQLVDFVRNDLQNNEVRIILRTGQPGAAPEWEIIAKYDINDYKTKTELTQEKLFTTLTAALRSYQQLHEINANQHGLEKIIQNNAALLTARSLTDFWNQTKSFLADLFPVTDDFLMLDLDRKQNISIRTHEGGGIFSSTPVECVLSDLPEDVSITIENTISSRSKQLRAKDITLFVATPRSRNLVIYFKLSRSLTAGEVRLLDVFVGNAAVAIENIELFENVQSLAYFDQLTGLRNRSALIDDLKNILRYIEYGDEFTLVDLDLDHFNDINDLIGQRHGDKVLQAFALHLEEICGATLALCRISGDEFGLLYKTKGLNSITFDPQKLLDSLHYEINVNAFDISIKASMGITKIQNKGQTAETILRKAGLSLRHAKDYGRGGHAYYADEMDSEVVQRASLTSDLRQALDRDEFQIFYQPQYDFVKKRMCGAEALLRWKKRGDEYISPAEFIPAMERSGLIVEVGEWILRQSCIDAQSWVGTPLEKISVAVNVSVVQLYKQNFVSMVSTILEETGLDPKRLKLEITESLIMQDADDASLILKELQKLGVSIAIDDFGIGYSSLSYLQQLPVNYVKIDQSFVKNLAHRSGDAVIVDVIITLGHSFGLQVIAEGVETYDQADFLKVIGCDQIQGYLYARPMPTCELLQLDVNKIL